MEPLVRQRQVQEIIVTGDDSIFVFPEFLKAHGPIGELTLRLLFLQKNKKPGVPGVGLDPLHDRIDCLAGSLQVLHEVSVLVEEHAGDIGSLVVDPALLQESLQLIVREELDR